MIQLEEEMAIEDINGVEVIEEDSEIAELIKQIKQGKIRIKKSKQKYMTVKTYRDRNGNLYYYI